MVRSVWLKLSVLLLPTQVFPGCQKDQIRYPIRWSLGIRTFTYLHHDTADQHWDMWDENLHLKYFHLCAMAAFAPRTMSVGTGNWQRSYCKQRHNFSKFPSAMSESFKHKGPVASHCKSVLSPSCPPLSLLSPKELEPKTASFPQAFIGIWVQNHPFKSHSMFSKQCHVSLLGWKPVCTCKQLISIAMSLLNVICQFY